MTKSIEANIVYCGFMPDIVNGDGAQSPIILSRSDIDDVKANIVVDFDRFVSDPSELDPRVIDLLEIASYVFEADRACDRGKRNSVYYNSWARRFKLHIPVRDFDFWTSSKVKTSLTEALTFMTGDASYEFAFSKISTEMQFENNSNTQMSLFNNKEAAVKKSLFSDIVLFSGGLDSFAGVLEYLTNNPERSICAVSHQSSPRVNKTQSIVYNAINKQFNNRMSVYKFKCTSKNVMPAVEESQRTRMFLFSAIAYAISSYYNKDKFIVYENGVTSINLYKQYDLMNARASRTTHPKTIALMKAFYRNFRSEFSIETPFAFKTKTEVVEIIKKLQAIDLLSSTVSCSSGRNVKRSETHCGICSQCIDRRLAVFAAEVDDYDEGIYAKDFITQELSDEAKQRLLSNLSLAHRGLEMSFADFFDEYSAELLDIVELNEQFADAEELLIAVFVMLQRHWRSVFDAVGKMRNRYDDVRKMVSHNSLLEIIGHREYDMTPFSIKARKIISVLEKTIPLAYNNGLRPKNEPDLNKKIRAILTGQEPNIESEYPVIRFGGSNFIPDHSIQEMYIESKYIRGTTTPYVVSDGIAADIIKAPEGAGLLFIVYDPDRKIPDDDAFKKPLMDKRKECLIAVIR